MGMDSSKKQQEIDAIKYAIENGLVHIDTAEMYSDGESERIVGEAIKGFKREDLFITSKCSPSHFMAGDFIDACESSLKRLGLDFVDLYLLHWPNSNVPLSEPMDGAHYLLDHGLIKRIGVSNFSVGLMEEAQRELNELVGDETYKIFTNQVEYSLSDLSPENDGVLEYCQKNDLILTAYSPLGQGALVEKGKHAALDEIAEKYGKTNVQVALNYLINQPNTIAIPKSSNKEHIGEILGSVGWRLKAEDVDQLHESMQT